MTAVQLFLTEWLWLQEAACQAFGGNLARIDSQVQNEYVYTLMDVTSTDGYWIGLNSNLATSGEYCGAKAICHCLGYLGMFRQLVVMVLQMTGSGAGAV